MPMGAYNYRIFYLYRLCIIDWKKEHLKIYTYLCTVPTIHFNLMNLYDWKKCFSKVCSPRYLGFEIGYRNNFFLILSVPHGKLNYEFSTTWQLFRHFGKRAVHTILHTISCLFYSIPQSVTYRHKIVDHPFLYYVTIS